MIDFYKHIIRSVTICPARWGEALCCGVRLSPSAGKLDQVASEDASQASDSDAAVQSCNCREVSASLASADNNRAKWPSVTAMRAGRQKWTSYSH